MKLTLQIENEEQSSFLDILVILVRNSTDKLKFAVIKNDTLTHSYILA